jgi:micrococcal nuclease
MDSELYTYKAYVISVYDGDSITVETDLGFGIKTKQKIRLSLIDTPELRGEEREAGLVARDALREKILNKNIYIKTEKDKTGKYGRYLATIYISEPFLSESEGHSNFVNVNKWLIENKYAEYYGTKTYL